MMVKKYRVELTDGERGELKGLVSRGRAAAYKQTHARILLLSGENQAEGPMMDREIARVLQVGTTTVERVRRRCVEEGLEAALGPASAVEPAPEETGRVWGGPPDCAGLPGAPRGTGQLDTAVAG